MMLTEYMIKELESERWKIQIVLQNLFEGFFEMWRSILQ